MEYKGMMRREGQAGDPAFLPDEAIDIELPPKRYICVVFYYRIISDAEGAGCGKKSGPKGLTGGGGGGQKQ